jgi:hypothetical protein
LRVGKVGFAAHDDDDVCWHSLVVLQGLIMRMNKCNWISDSHEGRYIGGAHDKSAPTEVQGSLFADIVGPNR